MMSLLATILGALFETLAAPVRAWVRERQARREGAEAERAAAGKQVTEAIQRIQQARETAPKTADEVVKRLRLGKFCLALAALLCVSACEPMRVSVICGTVKVWTAEEQRQAAAEIEVLQRVQPGAVIPYMMMDYGSMRDEARACRN